MHRHWIDRSRCQTCHNVDFCQRCHQSSTPRDHTGSFGGPSNRHCMNCHYPVNSFGAQRCAVCHRSSPTHAADKPKEDAVNPVHAILARFKKIGKFGGGSKLEKEAMLRPLVGKGAEAKKGGGGDISQPGARGRQAANSST